VAPSRWSSGSRSARSFGFIERAVEPCRTCFRACRQLKASLCNGRRSSGHWVCISLALPTVPLSLSFSLAARSNRLERAPKGSLHESLLSFSPVRLLPPQRPVIVLVVIVVIVIVIVIVVIVVVPVAALCKAATCKGTDRQSLRQVDTRESP